METKNTTLFQCQECGSQIVGVDNVRKFEGDVVCEKCNKIKNKIKVSGNQ